MATYVPVTVVQSGGAPFVQVSGNAPPMTVVPNSAPITLVQKDAPGVVLYNPDGSPYTGNAPPPAAVYLPNVGTSPSAVYGMRRLVSAYSGALIQVQRASDNATMDVAQDADGLPDAAPVVTWAAGSAVTIRTWYDQSGNSRHATNTALASQPIFDARGQYGAAGKWNAFRTAMFDGYYTNPVRAPKKLNVPTTVAFNLQNYSLFRVIDPKTAIFLDLYDTLYSPAAGNHEEAPVFTDTLISGIRVGGGGVNNQSSGRRPRQTPQTIGQVSSAAALKVYQDGQIISNTNKWTDPITGGIIGDSPTAFQDFLSQDAFLAWVAYPAALSDANGALVRDALDGTFGISAPTAVQVVGVGDSILWGAPVTASQNLQTIYRGMRGGIPGNPALYNMGISSQYLIGGLATNAATREFLLAADGSYAKRILMAQIGTNDMGNNGGVAGFGATLYTALTNYFTAARSAGFTRIVAQTLLPSTACQTGQKRIEYDDYNARVRANAAGADVILDLASHPTMGSFSVIGDLTRYQDALHPTGLGNFELATMGARVGGLPVNYLDAVNSAIAL